MRGAAKAAEERRIILSSSVNTFFVVLLIMSFKRRLKEEISYQDIRLKELAAQANLSLRTLESYVDAKERMPAADVAVRLAQALGVTVEYLVTGSDSFGKLREEFLPFRNFNMKLKQLSKSSWEKLEPLFVAMIDQELKSESEKRKQLFRLV